MSKTTSSVNNVLSEESLCRPLGDVFDLVCQIGKGSYGSVYRATYKTDPSHVVAIKQVPIESDFQEIIKEISIMQQCGDSPFIVQYLGSYFQESDLWIVMEYCGGGSVSDLMKLRHRTLSEQEISPIVQHALRGLEYIHLKKKIHRDIKAGNILLDLQGNAKLADFGVAGQLSDTMLKRNTVIGTPFWMAPEVIIEAGYDCAADVWSLGVTLLEMCEGKPPYADIHPMRAMFMIPLKPPPSFKELDKWSPSFLDFASKCLVKNPKNRSSTSDLLQHEFVCNAIHPSLILQKAIAEAQQNLNNNIEQQPKLEKLSEEAEETLIIVKDHDNNTMVKKNIDDYIEFSIDTIVRNEASNNSNHHSPSYLLPYCGTTSNYNTMIELESNMGTMVVSGSLKNTESSILNQPEFMKHFEEMNLSPTPDLVFIRKEVNMCQKGDLAFIENLSGAEMNLRLEMLNAEMEREMDEIRQKYEHRRKPILDAIQLKKKRMQMF